MIELISMNQYLCVIQSIKGLLLLNIIQIIYSTYIEAMAGLHRMAIYQLWPN